MADDEESDWQFETGEVATGDSPAATDADADGEEADAEGDEWRYSLSDVEDDEDDGDQSAVGGNVFGSLSSDTEIIEPGSPDIENTLFVLVGAVLALVFFLQFYLLMA